MKNFTLALLGLAILATLVEIGLGLAVLVACQIREWFGPDAGLISLLPLMVIVGAGIGWLVGGLRHRTPNAKE